MPRKIKMLTKELEKKLPRLYETENIPVEDKIAYVKYFNPMGAGTWYGLEYDPEEKLFFGYTIITDGEFGYFSLNELESIQLPLGMHIERDIYFKPTKISEIDDIKLM